MESGTTLSCKGHIEKRMQRPKNFYFGNCIHEKVYVLSIKVKVLLFSHCSVLLFAPNLDDFIFGQFETGQNWEAECHTQPWLFGSKWSLIDLHKTTFCWWCKRATLYLSVLLVTRLDSTSIQISDFQLKSAGLRCRLNLADSWRDRIDGWFVLENWIRTL